MQSCIIMQHSDPEIKAPLKLKGKQIMKENLQMWKKKSPVLTDK